MNTLRKEKVELEERVKKLSDSILNYQKKLVFYTSMKSRTQLLIILLKLKVNLFTTDLDAKFGNSRKTVLRIYGTWLPVFSSCISSFICWSSQTALTDLIT